MRSSRGSPLYRLPDVNFSIGNRPLLQSISLDIAPGHVVGLIADQDPTFKEVFYRRLLPDLKKKGKTVLVITHDDRYFTLAARYIKLDYGRIVEEGAGADLLRQPASA
jgi:putative pyoverdin transport system ATP-binding/permease protein